MLTKKRFMNRNIPKFLFRKEESIPENHAEVEQSPGEHEAPEEQRAQEEVQAELVSIAQSRPRIVINPPRRLG